MLRFIHIMEGTSSTCVVQASTRVADAIFVRAESCCEEGSHW